MPTRSSQSEHPGALLDIESYGRRGPAEHLSLQELQVIRATVRRHPEVMIKVLTQGGGGLKAVGAHLEYIGREGEVALEMDDGREIRTKAEITELLDEWNLDVEQSSSGGPVPRPTARRGKLAHKLVFSMPAGTPPKDVLGAVRDFAREEFGAMHRYALVLHTDELHPHVHLVVKAVSEEGRRLNIRKATLRAWRERFAVQLRRRGIAANATERAVRGQYSKALRDGIYRSAQRHESRHLNARRPVPSAPGRTLPQTRQRVEQGWEALVNRLTSEDARISPGLRGASSSQCRLCRPNSSCARKTLSRNCGATEMSARANSSRMRGRAPAEASVLSAACPGNRPKPASSGADPPSAGRGCRHRGPHRARHAPAVAR
jgi:Relaxase/Mobilisation nuclease domain